MKKHRILGFLISVMLLTLLLTTAFAAQLPAASLSSGTVEAGQSVTLTVTLDHNPGLATCTLYVYFDTSVFSLDPGKDIRIGSDFRGTGGLMTNTIQLADENGRYDGEPGRDGVLALWYSSSGMNSTAEGEFLSVTLHAAADARPGCYSVELGYSPDNTGNAGGVAVPLTTSGGTVTITTSEEVVPPVTDPVIPVIPVQPVFTDISGNWAEEYILKAAKMGLVEGTGGGIYNPDGEMTRAEFVTILWRAVGQPEPAGEASFTDLTRDWYKKPIAWAEENGIVNGFPNGTFDPQGHVTREQIVAVLHRMAGEPSGMESLFTAVYDAQFVDSAMVRSYAKNAMYWTIYEEILCGEASLTVGTELMPRTEATRSQIAVMIVRYLENK